MISAFVEGFKYIFKKWKASLSLLFFTFVGTIINQYIINKPLNDLMIFLGYYNNFFDALFIFAKSSLKDLLIIIGLNILMFILISLAITIYFNILNDSKKLLRYFDKAILLNLAIFFITICFSIIILLSGKFAIYLFIPYLIITIFLSVFLFFYYPLIMSTNLSYKEAYEESFKKMKENFFPVLFILFLISIISFAIETSGVIIYAYSDLLWFYIIYTSILNTLIYSWIINTAYIKTMK